MPEPRDPLLKVVNNWVVIGGLDTCMQGFEWFLAAGEPAEEITSGVVGKG